MRNLLFRGEMSAAAPFFGLYNREKDSFVSFTLATDEKAKQTEFEMKKKFEAMPGSATQKEEDRNWVFIGRTYQARTLLAETPCKISVPDQVSGQVWVSPKSIVHDKEKKPFGGTFVIDWSVKKLYEVKPVLEMKLTHSMALWESSQYMIPTAATKKMKNELFNPIGYPCYKEDKTDISEQGKNMNDITSYFSREPKPGDPQDRIRLYNEYINRNGIFINGDAEGK